MKRKFIYADLNGLSGNRMIVLNPLTFKEIIDTYGQAFSGMDLHLWTDDLDQNKYDPMIYPGKFIFDPNENSWFIEINPKEIEHHSSSKRYIGYSLEEILGKRYSTEKESHPEWF